MVEESIGRALEDLVETLEDGRRGFADAADELAREGHHEIADELRGFASQRARFSSELRDAAVARGWVIRQAGSMPGAIHRVWLSVREALTSDKVAHVLSAAETGEEHARKEYEQALAQPLPPDIRHVVARQATELAATHERIRDLRHAAPT